MSSVLCSKLCIHVAFIHEKIDIYDAVNVNVLLNNASIVPCGDRAVGMLSLFFSPFSA